MISITFGSNRFIGTNGIITFRNRGIDTELLKYELRSADSKPLINVEIRNANGELLGKVWKSTSFVHVHQDYEGKEEREGSDVKRMALIRKGDATTVFELIVHKPTDIEVNGIFYIAGFKQPIIATPNGLKIGGIMLSHNTKVSRGRGILLTQNMLSI